MVEDAPFSDDVPDAWQVRARLVWVPAPEVDTLGYCTECGMDAAVHVIEGVVSVREFHRAAWGRVWFLDEQE